MRARTNGRVESRAVALFVAAGLVVLLLLRASGPRESASVPAERDAEHPGSPKLASDGADVTAIGREPVVASDVAADGTADRATTAITGRCTHAGVGIVGVEVRVQLFVDAASHVASATTLADGRFAIAAAPGARQVDVRTQHDGFVATFDSFGRLTDEGLDVGDLELERASHVRGTVTERVGAPVEEALVRFTRRPIVGDPARAARRPVWLARVEADGSYATIVPAAVWDVSATGRGLARVEPVELDTRGGGEHVLDFVVDAVPAISGIVLDDERRPLARVPLELRGAHTGARAGLGGVTQPDGAFRLLGAVDWTYDEPVLVVRAAWELPGSVRADVEPTPAEWGADRVVVRASRPPTIRVRVRQRGGALVPGELAYRVSRTPRFGGPLATAPGDPGEFEVPVAPHAQWLFVMPEGEFASAGPFALVADATVSDGFVLVELERAGSLDVRVLWDGGAPVEGSVDLVWVPSEAEPVAAFESVAPARRPSLLDSPDAAWSHASAVLDAHGAAALVLPRIDGAYDDWLRIAPDDGVPRFERISGRRSLDVTLAGDARLAVLATGVWPQDARLVVARDGDGVAAASRWALDPRREPRAPSRRVPSGDWRVAIRTAGGEFTIDRFALAQGADVRREVRAEEHLWLPRRVTVAGVADGTEVELVWLGEASEPVVHRGTTVGDVLALPTLPRGAYEVRAGERVARLSASIAGSDAWALP